MENTDMSVKKILRRIELEKLLLIEIFKLESSLSTLQDRVGDSIYQLCKDNYESKLEIFKDILKDVQEGESGIKCL